MKIEGDCRMSSGVHALGWQWYTATFLVPQGTFPSMTTRRGSSRPKVQVPGLRWQKPCPAQQTLWGFARPRSKKYLCTYGCPFEISSNLQDPFAPLKVLTPFCMKKWLISNYSSPPDRRNSNCRKSSASPAWTRAACGPMFSHESRRPTSKQATPATNHRAVPAIASGVRGQQFTIFQAHLQRNQQTMQNNTLGSI